MSITDLPGFKTTRVRIGLQGAAEMRLCENVKTNGQLDGAYAYPPDDESNYWADVIEGGGEFYYRVGDTTVEINRDEHDKVIANPFLYYFSTALKLHNRIKLARGEFGLPYRTKD